MLYKCTIFVEFIVLDQFIENFGSHIPPYKKYYSYRHNKRKLRQKMRNVGLTFI